jgi:mannosyltransferase
MNIKLHFDDIIYQLQRYGGVSTYWKEITSRIVNTNDFEINRTIGSKITRYLPVYTNTQIFHSSYYRIPLSKSAKTVVTIHDFLYEYGYLQTLNAQTNIWQMKLAINAADAIVCVSENTKKDLIHFVPKVDINKIRVIYNGVDEKFKPINLDVHFNKKHLFEDFNYAIYVGDHKTNYKNFDMAIKACQIRNLQFLIVWM